MFEKDDTKIRTLYIVVTIHILLFAAESSLGMIYSETKCIGKSLSLYLLALAQGIPTRVHLMLLSGRIKVFVVPLLVSNGQSHFQQRCPASHKQHSWLQILWWLAGHQAPWHDWLHWAFSHGYHLPWIFRNLLGIQIVFSDCTYWLLYLIKMFTREFVHLLPARCCCNWTKSYRMSCNNRV